MRLLPDLLLTPVAPCTPSRSQARALAREYGLIPVYREVPDLGLNPVSAAARLSGPDEPGFLLESFEAGRGMARHSFAGYQPRPIELHGDGDVLAALAPLVAQETAPVTGLPPFHGGVVGYLGYETACQFERLPVAAGSAPPLPGHSFMMAESLVAFDHLTGRMKLITIHRPDREDYDEAVARIEQMASLLTPASKRRGSAVAVFDLDRARDGDGWQPNMSRQEFEGMVSAAREHILAGDAFQIVPSQRFSKPLRTSPRSLYRTLRAVNPAPYTFHLSLGAGRHVVGASPEFLLRSNGRRVQTRPLAGTRPRGQTSSADAAFEHELVTDAKERAEHVMLVDLGRNDIGRVAMPGSVRVDRLMDVERYSHVMHLSSTVSGELADGRTSLDALRAAFPAGTVSGAPKIRAMEIIANLEPHKRGVYAGALGYMGFGGKLDMAITLRTVAIADGVGHVQAGAGVVADSDPASEYRETLQKAQALFVAVDRAEAVS